MDSADKTTADLWTLAEQLSTPSDADVFFTRVMREFGNDSIDTSAPLINTGLQRLMENTQSDATHARVIIEKHILPICLERQGLISPVLDASGARQVLSRWVEQYPDQSRIPLRIALLEPVLDSLSTTPSVGSIKTLAALGLRSRGIERELMRLADRQDPLGSAAMAAICALGPNAQTRSRVVTSSTVLYNYNLI